MYQKVNTLWDAKTFLKKLLGYIGWQVKHLAVNQLAVERGKLTTLAS